MLDFTGNFKRFEQTTSNGYAKYNINLYWKYIDHAIVLARMDKQVQVHHMLECNIQTGEVLLR